MPLISCFHERHACSWPGFDGADSAEQMPDQGCSHSCDSGRAVIPLPSVPSSPDLFYGNTVAESSLSFVNQWNMLQTLHPATAFPSTFSHNSPLSSCKDTQILFLGALWEHPGSGEKALTSRSSSAGDLTPACEVPRVANHHAETNAPLAQNAN